ncbi:golgin subfamily A member 6-like protein 25 [Prorops nasuta]|uniref:golgin subfamily A member 6-like protein 25 n=1 Tax=Prorops nasuta TaxID=863751 RepID=UPI0034CF4A2A
MGVKEGIKGKRKGAEEEEEGIMEIEVKIGKEEWRIIGVYVGRGMRNIEDGLRRVVEREQGKKCLIGGDWNARVGEMREEEEEEGRTNMGRRSKDKVVNAEGRRMMDLMGEIRLEIFNGGVKGDREGEYTYVGHMGRSVIDFVVGDRETRGEIGEMEVEVRVESDHLPIVISLRKRWKKSGKREKIGGGVRKGWDKGQLERYKEKAAGIEGEEVEEVGERWERLQEKVRKVVEEVKKERNEEEGRKKGWWDEECRVRKRELRKKLRGWLRGLGEKEEYRREKRKYREKCEEKKERWREEWYKEMDTVRTEAEVWEIIRRSRRREINRVEEIGMREWGGISKSS